MSVINIQSARAKESREAERVQRAKNVVDSMIDRNDIEGGTALVAEAIEHADKDEIARLDKWAWDKLRQESEAEDSIMYDLIVKVAKSYLKMGESPCKK